jgi:long-chain acyl-CoA synthetase
MLCFTSGTTGDAKGSKETHAAFLADLYFYENSGLSFRDDDIHISYLPYAHVYEQCSFVKSIAHGFGNGYYSGDALKLLEDI